MFGLRRHALKWATTASAVAAVGASAWYVSSSQRTARAAPATKTSDSKSAAKSAPEIDAKATTPKPAVGPKSTHPASSASASAAAAAAAAATAPSIDEKELTLRQVTIVMRHGARTPIDILPGETKEQFDAVWAGQCGSTDPGGADTPCKLGGQLTRRGRQQGIEVGRYLRQRYITGENKEEAKKPAAPAAAVVDASDADSEYEPIDAAAVPILKNPPPPPPIATPSSVGFFPAAFTAPAAAAGSAADPFFYLRATTVERTQLTLAGVFQGLYPEQYPNEASANSFVAANTEVRAHRATGDDPKSSHNVRDETLYPMWAACDRVRELYWVHRLAPRMQMFESGPRALEIRNRLADEFKTPRDHYGLTWIPLYDGLQCRSFHRLAPLTRIEKSEQREIDDIAHGVFSGVLGGSDEILRLGVGRLLQEMLQRMERTVQPAVAAPAVAAPAVAAVAPAATAAVPASAKGKAAKPAAAPTPAVAPAAAASGVPRATLYATHDTTLIPLSFTLPGVYDPNEWPPYASHVIIELLEHTPKAKPAAAAAAAAAGSAPKWYVRVLSNGKQTSMMPFSELQALWKPYIPTDWVSECKVTHKKAIPPQRW